MKINVDLIVKDLASRVFKQAGANYAATQKQIQRDAKATTEALNKQAAAAKRAATATATSGNVGGGANSRLSVARNKNDFLAKAWDKNTNIINKDYLQNLSGLAAGYEKFNRAAESSLVLHKGVLKTLDDESLAFQRFVLKGNLATRTIDNMAKNLTNMGKNAQWTGRQMMVGITAPVMALTTVAVKLGMELDKAQIRLKKLVSNDANGAALEQNMEELNAQARELSESYGTARTELTAVQGEFAALGVGVKKIKDLTTASLQFSVVGDVDLSASQKMVQVLFQAGLAGKTYEEQMESLNTTLAKFNAIEDATNLNMADIADSFATAYPTLKRYNTTAEETVALLSGITQGGFDASEAANTLKYSMSKYVSALSIIDQGETGGQMRLKAVVESINTMNEQFGTGISLFKPGTDDELRDGVDLLSQLASGYALLMKSGREGKNEAIETIRNIFGANQDAKGSQLLEALAKSMDVTTASGQDMAKAMAIASDESEQAQQQWEKQIGIFLGADSTKMQGQIQKLINSAQDLGKELLPVATKVFEYINKIVSAFNNLDPGTKELILKIVAAFALLGPAVYIAGQGMIAFGTVGRGLAAIPKSLFKIKSMFRDVGSDIDGYAERMEALRKQFSTGVIDKDTFIEKSRALTDEQTLLGIETEKTNDALREQKALIQSTGPSGVAGAAASTTPDQRAAALDAAESQQRRAKQPIDFLDEVVAASLASETREAATGSDLSSIDVLQQGIADRNNAIVDAASEEIERGRQDLFDKMAELEVEKNKLAGKNVGVPISRGLTADKKNVGMLKEFAEVFGDVGIPFVDDTDTPEFIRSVAQERVDEFSHTMKEHLKGAAKANGTSLTAVVRDLGHGNNLRVLNDPKILRQVAEQIHGAGSDEFTDAINKAMQKTRGIGSPVARKELSTYGKLADYIRDNGSKDGLPVPMVQEQVKNISHLMTAGPQNYQFESALQTLADRLEAGFRLQSGDAAGARPISEEVERRIVEAVKTDAQIEDEVRKGMKDSPSRAINRAIQDAKDKRDAARANLEDSTIRSLYESNYRSLVENEGDGVGRGAEGEQRTRAMNDLTTKLKEGLGWEDDEGRREVLGRAGWKEITDVTEDAFRGQFQTIGADIPLGPMDARGAIEWQKQVADLMRKAPDSPGDALALKNFLSQGLPSFHMQALDSAMFGGNRKTSGNKVGYMDQVFRGITESLTDQIASLDEVGFAGVADFEEKNAGILGDREAMRKEIIKSRGRKGEGWEKRAKFFENMLDAHDIRELMGDESDADLDKQEKEIKGKLRKIYDDFNDPSKGVSVHKDKSRDELKKESKKIQKRIANIKKAGGPMMEERLAAAMKEIQDIEDAITMSVDKKVLQDQLRRNAEKKTTRKNRRGEADALEREARSIMAPATKTAQEARAEAVQLKSVLDDVERQKSTFMTEVHGVMDELTAQSVDNLSDQGIGTQDKRVVDQYRKSSQVRLNGMAETATALEGVDRAMSQTSMDIQDGFGYFKGELEGGSGSLGDPTNNVNLHGAVEDVQRATDAMSDRMESNRHAMYAIDDALEQVTADFGPDENVRANVAASRIARLNKQREQLEAEQRRLSRALKELGTASAGEKIEPIQPVKITDSDGNTRVVRNIKQYEDQRRASLEDLLRTNNIDKLGEREREVVEALIAQDLQNQEKTDDLIRNARLNELDDRIANTARDEQRKQGIMQRLVGDKYLGPEDADSAIMGIHADDIAAGREARTHISDDEIRAWQDGTFQAKNRYMDDIDNGLHGPFSPNAPDRDSVAALPFEAFSEIADGDGKKMTKILPDIASGVDDVAKAGTKATGKGGILNALTWLNPMKAMEKMKLGGVEKALSPMLIGQFGAGGGAMASVLAYAAPIAAILAAIGAAIAVLWVNFNKWKDSAKEGLDRLKEAFTTIKDAIFGPLSELWKRLSGEGEDSKAGEGMADMWTRIGQIIGWVADKTAAFMEWLAPVVEAAVSQIAGHIEAIINVIQAIIAVFTGNWGDAWDHIMEAGYLFGVTFVNLFNNIVISIIRLLAKIPVYVFEIFASIANGIYDLARKIPGMSELLPDNDINPDDYTKGYEDTVNGWIDSLQEMVTFDNPYEGGTAKDFFDNFNKEGQEAADEEDPIVMPAPEADPDAAAQNARDAVQAFMSAMQNQLRKVVDGWKTAALRAFDDYAKGAIQAFDDKIEAINKEVKAEKERDQDLEYLRRKEELREKRRSMRIKHQTDRDLAIYEGRFDDAKQMDYDYGQELVQQQNDEKALEDERQQTLTDRARQGEIDRINVQKEAMQEALDLRREQLQLELDMLTEYIPKNVAEAERMHQEIQAKMMEYTNGYGVIAASQAGMWGATWHTAFANAKTQVAEEAYWAGEAAMKEFASGLGIDPSSLVMSGPGHGGGGGGSGYNQDNVDLDKIAQDILTPRSGPDLWRHTGGPIGNTAGAPSDVDATLQTGEYVIQRKAVRHLGTDFLDNLNQAHKPIFHEGGKVGMAKQAMSQRFASVLEAFKSGGMRIGQHRDEKGNLVGGFTADEYRDALKRQYDEKYNFGGGTPGTGPLAGVHPKLVAAFNAYNNLLGGILSVVSGYRSSAQQAALYAAYKAGRGNLAAPPGQSNHEYGLAIDHAPNATGSMKATAATVGIEYPIASEPWHIQFVGLNKNTIGRGPGPAFADMSDDGGVRPDANPNFKLRDNLINPPTGPIGDGSKFQGVMAGSDVAGHVIDNAGIRTPSKVAIMTAVAARESGWNPRAHAVDSDDDSRGLWQINVRPEANPQYKTWDLFNPAVNAEVMGIMSGHGANLRPWAMNPDGSAMYSGYEINRFMDSAKDGARIALSARGMPSLDTGGNILKDGVAMVHRGETVMNARISKALSDSQLNNNFRTQQNQVAGMIAAAIANSGGSDNSSGGYDGPLVVVELGNYLGSDRELEKLVDTIDKRITPKLQRARGAEKRTFSTK